MNQREISALMNIVRIGTISSVDVEKRTARVEFADKQSADGKPLISGPLKVIENQPLIVYKKWDKDESIPGQEPNTLEEIIITEENNADYLPIYHSADRALSVGEKYAKYKANEYEPDYIKNIPDKVLIKIYPWLPFIGQLVLCVYMPNGESDGFIIGGI